MSDDTINANEHLQDRETPATLAHKLYMPMFAERANIKEAYAYVQDVVRNTENSAATMTAVHVLLNTVAKEIEKLGG